MQTRVVALELPWSLYENAKAQKTDRTIHLSASGVPALAIDARLTLQYARRRHQPFPTGEPIQWARQRWRIWNLPAAGAGGDDLIELRLHDKRGAMQRASLCISGSLGRYDKERLADPRNEQALDREMLLGVIIDQIITLTDLDHAEIAAQGKMRGWIRSDWRRVDDLLRKERDVNEPRMALIVRHAQSLHRLVNDLGRHPRRVLTRNRRLQAVHRIQEMDSGCLSWYVRQPGRTPVEKAGARQALMAVVREETIDTPENRVLRDFLTRTVQTADGYLAANRNLKDSIRYGEVSRYARMCAALLRRPEFSEVRPLVGTAQPNYVLTSDQRYRRIWDAYQKLLRRQDDQDEAWTWQTRLWADMTALAVHSGLLSAYETLTIPPIYLHTEQDRGRWLDLRGCSGVFATQERVIMVYAASSAPTEMQERYAVLGPHLIIRLQPFGKAPEKDVLVWAIASVGENNNSLEELTQRAARAVTRWHRELHRSIHHSPRMRGIVVAAPMRHDDPLKTAAYGDVIGVELPLEGRDFLPGLQTLASVISAGKLR